MDKYGNIDDNKSSFPWETLVFSWKKCRKSQWLTLDPSLQLVSCKKLGYFYITEECGIDSYIIMDSYSILYIIGVRCYKLQTWHLICKIGIQPIPIPSYTHINGTISIENRSKYTIQVHGCFLSSYNNQILRVTKCEKAAKAGSFSNLKGPWEQQLWLSKFGGTPIFSTMNGYWTISLGSSELWNPQTFSDAARNIGGWNPGLHVLNTMACSACTSVRPCVLRHLQVDHRNLHIFKLPLGPAPRKLSTSQLVLDPATWI